MKKIRKRIIRKSFLRLLKLARAMNLSFSKYFAFGNKMVGVDRKRKALLISEGAGDHGPSHLIDLEKIKKVSLSRSYGSIQAGELGRNELQHFLKYIRLQFEHRNNETAVLALYDNEKDENTDLIRIDSGSKSLHNLLSQIIGDSKKLVPAAN